MITLASGLTGCVTSPPAEGTTVSAYSVGDRGRVQFEEVVVSLPLRGATVPYQNLHVGPAALVNATRKTSYPPYLVEQILRRIEIRLAARLTEVLSGSGEQSLADMAALRRQILAQAQGVVDEALRQWEHGSDYRVEVVIVSLYWTDPSVGRSQQHRGLWW